MPEQMHNGLSVYLQRMNIDPGPSRSDAAIVLVVGQRFRIHCRPAPFGDLAFECRILDIPALQNEADDLIRECMLASWSRMHEFSDVPVLSADSTALMLQQRLSADSTAAEFELALEAYANALSDWRRIFRVL